MEVGRGLLVVENSIVKNIEKGVCDRCEDCMVTCLLGAKTADITPCPYRLVESAGEEVAGWHQRCGEMYLRGPKDQI